MNELNEVHRLRAMVKLSEKPEIKALELSLVATLRGRITADSILFYELRNLTNPATHEPEMHLFPMAPENDHGKVQPASVLLDGLAGFRQCLDRLEMVVVPVTGSSGAPRWHFIHPVLGAKGGCIGVIGLIGFIVVESAEQIPRDLELLATLLDFYRNYAALLQDNQHDHLTGLLNRKAFDDHMMRIILSLSDMNRRKADKIDYCAVVLDIDYFKNVKNTHGHLMADEILLHFSQCMNSSFRDYDLLFRFGGEEFVVVMKNVSPDAAKTVLERFRVMVENHYFPQAGRVTVSIGVTEISGKDLPMTIIDRADQALCHAKNNGRNQVCFYECLLAENKLVNKAARTDIELF